MKKLVPFILATALLAGCSTSDLTQPINEDRANEVESKNAPVSVSHELTYQDTSYGELLETTVTLEDGREVTCLVAFGGGNISCFDPAANESLGELP